MAFRSKVTLGDADQTDQQKDRTDQNVHAVKSGSHKEVSECDLAGEGPAINDQQFVVFIDLKCCEDRAKSNRQDQPHAQIFAVVVMHQGVVCPCRCTAGDQKQERVDQRQLESVDLVELRLHILRADIFIHRVKLMFEKAPEPR